MATGVITRGRAVRGDLSLWDGVSLTSTRIDATGGTITGLAVGDSVDVLQVYGSGQNRTKSSIDQAIAAIGSVREATLAFAPGTWTIDADLSIPNNFSIHIPRGCEFDVSSGKTLTFSGSVISETSDFSTGSGTVALETDSVIDGKAWIATTDFENSAGVTPTDHFRVESDLYRYGANLVPGTTDMTSALESAALVAAYTGKIFIPLESIKTTAATALPSNVTVIGGGYLSNLSAAATNQTAIFTTSSKSNVRIEGIRFTGSDTSSGTANGNAIQCNNSDHVKVDNCWFTLFRGPPVFFNGDGGTHNDFVVSGCYFYENKSASPIGELNIYGTINGTQVLNCRFEASATEPFGRGVFISNLSSSLNWKDITVDGCYFSGYANNGIGTGDEDPSATFDCGIVKVTNCTILSSVQCGIKLKNSQRSIVTHNYLADCDSVPEASGSLQGTIYINACQDTICSDNIIIAPGTDGIRINGLNTASGGTTAGAGRSSMNVHNNIIESAVEAGIYVTDDTYESSIIGNTIRNSAGPGITIQPGSSKAALSIIVSNNRVRGAGGSAAGIHAEYTTALTITGNQVKLCGGFGIDITNCAEVSFTGNTVMDNGVGNTNTSGIRINASSDVQVSGNRAGNSVATDQDYGLDIGSSVTDLVITGNNFTGNQISGTLGVTQDAMIWGNIGLSNNNTTAANLAAVGNIVNTAGKETGKVVFDTTNARLMVAVGPLAADRWYVADASANVLPS